MTYRIMVRGEDNLLFCFKNGLEDNVTLAEWFDAAVEEYPCAMIFVEKEDET